MVGYSIFCRVESEYKVNQFSSATKMMVCLHRMCFKNIFEVSYQSFDFFWIDDGATSSVFDLSSFRFKNQLKVVEFLYILYDISNEIFVFYETVCSIHAFLINWFLRLRISRIVSFIDLQLSFFLLKLSRETLTCLVLDAHLDKAFF